MINYAIISNVENNKRVAIVAHDYEKGRLIFKGTNEYIISLFKILFDKKFYRIKEEDDIEFKEQVGRHDKDLLEIALTDLEKYKVVEYWEDVEGNLDKLIEEKFQEMNSSK